MTALFFGGFVVRSPVLLSLHDSRYDQNDVPRSAADPECSADICCKVAAGPGGDTAPNVTSRGILLKMDPPANPVEKKIFESNVFNMLVRHHPEKFPTLSFAM